MAKKGGKKKNGQMPQMAAAEPEPAPERVPPAWTPVKLEPDGLDDVAFRAQATVPPAEYEESSPAIVPEELWLTYQVRPTACHVEHRLPP